MSSDHRPQSFDCLALLDLEQFLGRTLPILSEAEHSLEVLSCRNLRRHSPEVLHLLSIELGPILYRNPQCHPRVSKYWTDLTGPNCIMSSGCLKEIMDQKSNLPELEILSAHQGNVFLQLTATSQDRTLSLLSPLL